MKDWKMLGEQLGNSCSQGDFGPKMGLPSAVSC